VEQMMAELAPVNDMALVQRDAAVLNQGIRRELRRSDRF
jgi:hypothetical protein